MLSDSLALRPLEFDVKEGKGVHAKRRRELPPNISTNTRRGIGARVESESGGTLPYKEAVGGLM